MSNENETKNIYVKQMLISTEIKCPKSRFNSFGNFSSRNIEDIFNAAKPLLKEYKCSLKLDNELYELGGHIFRKSIATLTCVETKESITAVSHTRENLHHKKMSPEQMSGSCASYSDKYALGKMFLLDDSVDPDEQKQEDMSGKEDLTPLQNTLRELIKASGKYDPSFESFLTGLSKQQLNTKINEYKAKK